MADPTTATTTTDPTPAQTATANSTNADGKAKKKRRQLPTPPALTSPQYGGSIRSMGNVRERPPPEYNLEHKPLLEKDEKATRRCCGCCGKGCCGCGCTIL